MIPTEDGQCEVPRERTDSGLSLIGRCPVPFLSDREHDVHQQDEGSAVAREGLWASSAPLPHLADSACLGVPALGHQHGHGVQVRPADPAQPGIRYPEYHGGPCAVDRTDDRW